MLNETRFFEATNNSLLRKHFMLRVTSAAAV